MEIAVGGKEESILHELEKSFIGIESTYAQSFFLSCVCSLSLVLLRDTIKVFSGQPCLQSSRNHVAKLRNAGSLSGYVARENRQMMLNVG